MLAQFNKCMSNIVEKLSNSKPQSTTTACAANSNMLEYRLITPDRFDDVIAHLRVNFPDEPLNASVGLCKHGQPCPLLEKHHMLTMQDGMSLVVVDTEKNKIVGVVLNGITRTGETEQHLKEIKTIDNLEYQRIFGLLDEVNISLDLFSKYNVDKMFDIRILSVDSNYRGKGIAKDLFKRSETVAKDNGFHVMKTDATSLFTQKVAESCGWHVEKSVTYGDYLDDNGKKMYNTKSPHDYYKIMAKILSPNNKR